MGTSRALSTAIASASSRCPRTDGSPTLPRLERRRACRPEPHAIPQPQHLPAPERHIHLRADRQRRVVFSVTLVLCVPASSHSPSTLAAPTATCTSSTCCWPTSAAHRRVPGRIRATDHDGIERLLDRAAVIPHALRQQHRHGHDRASHRDRDRRQFERQLHHPAFSNNHKTNNAHTKNRTAATAYAPRRRGVVPRVASGSRTTSGFFFAGIVRCHRQLLCRRRRAFLFQFLHQGHATADANRTGLAARLLLQHHDEPAITGQARRHRGLLPWALQRPSRQPRALQHPPL